MNETAQDRRFAARGRVVLVLIAAMLAIQAIRGWLSAETDLRLLLSLAFVPAGFTDLLDPNAVTEAVQSVFREHTATADDVDTLKEALAPRPWMPVTYAFLHGNWTHVVVNAVWFAAFGSAVARRFGAMRFLLFFAASAIGGAAVHLATHALDLAPLVGASAVVSGTMAAAARFAFAAGAPLGPGAQRGTLAAYLGPPLSLGQTLADRRVVTFLGLWFGLNFLFGAVVTPLDAGGTIAWQAHVGGFLVGLLLFPVFDPVGDPPRASAPQSPEHP